MDYKSVLIDGSKLRSLMASRGIRQQEIVTAMKVQKAQVSRWMASGSRWIRVATLEGIAAVLNMPYDEIKKAVSPTPQPIADLRDDEAEWLEVWKKLKPLQRYGLRLHVEEYVANMIKEESANANHHSGRSKK
jgi:transcriptional regulator with XRE-family HTH domain